MQLPQGFERFPYQSLVEGTVWAATFISLLVWGISLVNGALKRHQQMKMQRHLLDKFASAHDFAEFLQSPAGQKYVLNLSEPGSSPRNSILNSVRLGIVLLFVGPAFCMVPFSNAEIRHGVWGLGLVIMLLGVGFLVSAAVSYYVAKRIKSEQAE